MSTSETRKPITAEQEQELDEAFARAREALAIIETYDQARVDRLCQAVAWAVSNRRTFTGLVEMGIAESGLGDAESRMNKRMKIRGVLRDALRQKSVGIIEELPEKGIVKYGKPAGIVACVVPTTNPDLTPAGNAIYAIKARDVVIFSPVSTNRTSTVFIRPTASTSHKRPFNSARRGLLPHAYVNVLPTIAPSPAEPAAASARSVPT